MNAKEVTAKLIMIATKRKSISSSLRHPNLLHLGIKDCQVRPRGRLLGVPPSAAKIKPENDFSGRILKTLTYEVSCRARVE